MQRSFYHQSLLKLLALIRRTKLSHVDKGKWEMLEDISKSCVNWQRFLTIPQNLKSEIFRGDAAVNFKIALDLDYTENKAFCLLSTSIQISAPL